MGAAKVLSDTRGAVTSRVHENEMKGLSGCKKSAPRYKAALKKARVAYAAAGETWDNSHT